MVGSFRMKNVVMATKGPSDVCFLRFALYIILVVVNTGSSSILQALPSLSIFLHLLPPRKAHALAK